MKINKVNNINILELTDIELHTIFDTIAHNIEERCDDSLICDKRYPKDRIEAMSLMYYKLIEQKAKWWYSE
ncbi:MAG: hypothetical protein WC877_01120 [Dehalococcoidales bacterium]|jgi:hypothetical protein